ncbi:MAG TPA: ATP-binding protein [Baekduia sp.]|jgi:signal transduction histidine kinase|nr:ATP-binding protein [Baekduia sp.]
MADGSGAARGGMSRLRSGQWLALTAGALVVVALIGVGVSLVALHRLTVARTAVVDRADPGRVLSAQYFNGLINQETGIRGFALSGRREFLTPFSAGGRDAAVARRRLQAIADTGDVPRLADDLGTIGVRATSWHLLYADPVVLAVRRSGASGQDVPQLQQGRRLFDDVRAAFGTMDGHLAAARADARGRLQDAARAAQWAVLLTGLLVLAAAFVAGATLRRVMARPLARLARDARRVSRGEFGHPVAVQGPRDVVGLSGDVDSMRRKIVAELDAAGAARARLEEQALDLQRSNAELEQFAYVASHDLQEPLRKVASFCGMLQHRYHGQLDERADQYIDFAVDGAKRMQGLINDLLAFSRVGRVGAEHVLLDMDEIAADAVGNLEPAIEEAGATVEVDGPLPAVRGDRSLLTALLQNLIANGIKFRSDEPPHVRLSVQRDGDAFTFAVDDNGIGIAPRYADRIFVIFQRLHPKEEYSGTGIGLAMCRKIVEYHGGEIRLETEGAEGGASFRFTLPVPEEDATP